jgi:hypothetical protein
MAVNWTQFRNLDVIGSMAYGDQEYGDAWENAHVYFSYAIRDGLRSNKVRVTFNLEVKAEIDSFDSEKRKVFIEMMTRAARELYTKATLLSGNTSPVISATVEDNRNGVEEVDLFRENGRKK